MTISYLPRPALSESILRALGRGQELVLGDVMSKVRSDYGTVSRRSVLRYLAAMARRGDVRRDGKPRCFVYRSAQ